MDEKKIKLRKLVSLYIFIIILTIIIVGPAHIYPQPYLMSFRFPHYLQMMRPFFGISWPLSFEIYHYVLYILVIIGSFNVSGIFFYNKFKRMALVSSSIGLLLISLMVLFFFFVFLSVNVLTALIYGLYSIVLLIADVLTFKALITQKKGA